MLFLLIANTICAGMQAERDAVQIEDEERVAEYLALSQQLGKLRRELRRVVCAPQHALPFLQPGRLVRVLPPAAEQPAQRPQQGERRRGGWQRGSVAWGRLGRAVCGGAEPANCVDSSPLLPGCAALKLCRRLVLGPVTALLRCCLATK
jgi:hypothetical protein